MLKLLSDENIFPSTLELLRCHGLDVKDIKEMKLCGINDKEVMELARREDRPLITLDMHFSNIFLFPPSECPGIIVVRVRPAVPSKVDLYGSYAKGCPKEYSDIDLAVISPAFGNDIIEEGVMLMLAFQDVSIMIEPKVYSREDYESAEPGTFLHDEITKKGIQIC
jgi:predicted nuclease of predicted toxin-antitoxin system